MWPQGHTACTWWALGVGTGTANQESRVQNRNGGPETRQRIRYFMMNSCIHSTVISLNMMGMRTHGEEGGQDPGTHGHLLSPGPVVDNTPCAHTSGCSEGHCPDVGVPRCP